MKKLAVIICVTAGLTCQFGVPNAYGGELRGPIKLETPIPPHTQAESSKSPDIETLKDRFVHMRKSQKLVDELNFIISNFNEQTPFMYRIDIELYKLETLSKIGDFEAAADLANEIYLSYPRASFPSENLFGDTLYQIVESLAKTDNLGVSYDIIQKLRLSILNEPNSYLSFILDKCLVEVYIETSDYKRSLDLALSMMENSNYKSITKVQNWYPTAINEIAYLYNKLGDGKNALIYLEKSADIIKTKDPSLKKNRKSLALNYANKGRAYLLIGNYKEAERMGAKLAVANETLHQDYLLAVSHRLIGSAAYHQGFYPKAMKELEAGIELLGTNTNLSLKSGLYKDYALSLEKLGKNADAIQWYKKLFEVEMTRQEIMATTRSNLSEVEFKALQNYQDIIHLEHELDRNKAKNKLMIVTILSLLSGLGILAWILLYMRKSQKHIISSEKKAQAATQAKSEFLANMSHEIRTPMNGVLGMTQVLEKTGLTPQQKFYLNIVKSSGVELLAVINNILDFSKIEADKLTLQIKTCDLSQIIQDVVFLLTPKAQEKDIELNYNFPPELAQLYMADCHRFRQIIMNLVGNAIKFTEKGSVTIDVTGHIMDDDAQIQINVSDTGIGITPGKTASIFEKFTQAEDSTTRQHTGTGLGLAISRKLAEAMNGDLSVTSELGKGSTFLFTLPLKLASSPSVQEPSVLEAPTALTFVA